MCKFCLSQLWIGIWHVPDVVLRMIGAGVCTILTYNVLGFWVVIQRKVLEISRNWRPFPSSETCFEGTGSGITGHSAQNVRWRSCTILTCNVLLGVTGVTVIQRKVLEISRNRRPFPSSETCLENNKLRDNWPRLTPISYQRPRGEHWGIQIHLSANLLSRIKDGVTWLSRTWSLEIRLFKIIKLKTGLLSLHNVFKVTESTWFGQNKVDLGRQRKTADFTLTNIRDYSWITKMLTP